MANWHTCKTFSQIKSKKRSTAAENRNGENESQPKFFDSKNVNPGLTFENATNSHQQRTAPVDKIEPVKKKSLPVSVINQDGETTSGGKYRNFTQKQWEKTLTFLYTDDGFLRGLARSFRKKRYSIPTLKGPTTTAYSDTEKAESLADSPENQFKLNDISNPQHLKNHTRLVIKFFTNGNNFDDNPTNLKPSEILTYINTLKIEKAPGRDPKSGLLPTSLKNSFSYPDFETW
ncbi:hypothetical protein TNCV_4464231 [Trichonephila clavipes]|nr:hypothetical protein TNCV_4464231 [Trichonephila clavipes]